MTEMDPPAPAAPEPASPPSAPPPAWQPPAPQAPPAQALARPSRPATVTAASVILIVLGTLVSLLGLLVVLGGALMGSISDTPRLGIDLGGLPAAAGVFVAVMGAIILAFGVIELVSGIFALLGRAWARIVAIVISVLGGLLALLGVFYVSAQDASGPAVSIVLMVAYVFVAWAMASAGRYFAER